MFLSKLRLLVKRPSLNFFSSFHTQNLVSHPQISSSNLSLLADKCTSLNQLKQIHAQMIVSDHVIDSAAASRIISFCAESGDHSYPLALFNNTHEPNSFMCNTIISAQANSSNPAEAILLYMKMRKLGVRPDNYTFASVLKACKDIHLLNSGKQFHTEVIKFGLDLDMYVINSLISYYGVCGDMSDAWKLFEEVPVRDSIIWTMIVSGYTQNLEVPVRNFIICTMIVSGYIQNFCSDEVLILFDQTLFSVLCACARSLSLESVEQMCVKDRKIEIGLMLGTALVDMYAEKGEISLARSLFRKMPERNTGTWNAMICGLADHGHAVEALELFQEMEKEEIMPNDITFSGVLSACRRAGLLEVSQDIFLSMKRVYGNELKIEHYRCMVDLLAKGGRLVEAEELINGTVCEADIVVLGDLLEACRNHGNIAIAERVLKKILHLEPQNHGVYTVLSSMRADAGRWEGDLMLKKEMKDGGLTKIPVSENELTLKKEVKDEGLTKTPGWGFVDSWMDLTKKHIL